jgi:hypothetical protein
MDELRASEPVARRLMLRALLSVLSCSAVLPSSIGYWSSTVPPSGTTPPSVYQARSGFSTAVDPNNAIFVVAGLSLTAASSNDAWMSTDSGASWSCQTCKNIEAPAFSPRHNAGLGINPVAGSQGGFTMYLIGGIEDGGSGLPVNDQWNSTDQGITWNLMGTNRPWGLRTVDETPSVLFDTSQNM